MKKMSIIADGYKYTDIVDDALTVKTVKREKRVWSDRQQKSQASFLDDFGALFSLTLDQLRELPKEMLVDWCLVVGVSATGNKSQLVHNLAEWVSNHSADADKLAGNGLSLYPTLYGYMTTDDLISDEEAHALIFDYMYNANQCEQLARAVVCSIARAKGYVKGKEACQNLKDNGFRDEIWEDIKQAVNMAVWSAVKGGSLYLENGLSRFHGRAFGKLFSAVYETLKSYKWTDTSNAWASCVSLCSRTEKEDENGEKEFEYSEEIIRLTDQNAVSTLSQLANIDKFEQLEFIREFKAYCQNELSAKKFDFAWDVLRLRTDGLKFQEIGDMLNVSKKTAERAMLTLKTLRIAFGQDMTREAIADNRQFGCVSGPASYNDRICYQVGNMTGYNNAPVEFVPVELDEDAIKKAYSRTWRQYEIKPEQEKRYALMKQWIAEGFAIRIRD